MSGSWSRAAVLLFACLIFLPNLGAFGLWDPWETHYGAVTTNMVETYQWVSPWWGYKQQIGTEPRQGNYFYSKPIFTFWTEGAMSRLIGRGEWAIRLPMALLAILGVFVVYITVSKLWSRPAGLLGALVLGTSPEYYMISRQAQTDMPFVATMMIALCFLMLAYFGPRERMSRRGFWGWIWGMLAFIALNTLPQLGIVAMDLEDPVPANLHGLAWLGAYIQYSGWVQALIYLAALGVVLFLYGRDLRQDLRREGLSDGVKDRWLRRIYMVVFYIMVAQSTYAKGLLGFMLPGLMLLMYLIFSANWSMLKRSELTRGVVMTMIVGLPWYVAMFCRHGMPYYQRFFIHDHFNRLAAGVYEIDSGNFEHFIKWLGLGLFPWVAFVPLAIAWLARQNLRDNNRQKQARIFLLFWFVSAFALFTLSATKFHHYIFPAQPALAMLVALFLLDLVHDRTWFGRLAAVVGILFFSGVARDLQKDPQHLRNLMTFKYDRAWPQHLPTDADAPIANGDKTPWKDTVFWKETSPTLHAIMTTKLFQWHRWMVIMTVVGLLAFALFFFARTRVAGVFGLALLATALAGWALNYYMPILAPHWSQKYLFDTYYDTCHAMKPPPEVSDAYEPLVTRMGMPGIEHFFRGQDKRLCKEDVISWLITWRGETYYSFNEVKPITKEETQFLPYLEQFNHGQPFYIIMQRGKMGGFKSKLESYSNKLRRKGAEGFGDIERWNVEVVNDSNLYFQMVKATPVKTSQGRTPTH